jgi:hypothetical protein
MYRIVLDPTVLIRGLFNPDSICGRLLSLYSNRYQALFSAKTIRVVATLLMNETWPIKFPAFKRIDPAAVGRLLRSAPIIPVPAPQHRNPFVAVAMAANADYLVCEHPLFLHSLEALPMPTLSTRAFIALLETETPVSHQGIAKQGDPSVSDK